ncbi:MAG: TolC family protein [Bacteroidota bacterium]
MIKRSIITGLFLVTLLSSGFGQETAGAWSLDDCISYALGKNITVQQAGLASDRNSLYLEQARAARLPSLSAGLSQNFSWGKSYDVQNSTYGSMEGSANGSYSISSGMTLFNGNRLQNGISQSELNLESSQYYSETVKETLELNILSAFLQVVYTGESVANAEKQIEATREQLALAEERQKLGAISRSDYLQIKSELASENLTLAQAKSQYSLARVSLMQLMELPVDDSFRIAIPDLDQILNEEREPDAAGIYEQALAIKPQIMQAELNKQSAGLEDKIARAGLYPSVTLNAGLGTSYASNLETVSYGSQIGNQISPSVGLQISVPIFQKKQVKTDIGLARISYSEAELEEINTRNQLRKDIEQATADVLSAQMEYEASLEKYRALQESNQVSLEKFSLGLMSSVDYLYEKTSLITAESSLLQSKFRLIFSYKILDFYKGIPISL